MNASETVCPMAVPFKVAHFHLSRWTELKAQLAQSRLFRAVEELASPEAEAASFLCAARQEFLVPPGTHAELDEAMTGDILAGNGPG